jgi:hypothetical protein
MYQEGGSTDLPNHSVRQSTGKSAHSGGQFAGSKPALRSATRKPRTKKVQIVPGRSQGLSCLYSARAVLSSSDR